MDQDNIGDALVGGIPLRDFRQLCRDSDTLPDAIAEIVKLSREIEELKHPSPEQAFDNSLTTADLTLLGELHVMAETPKESE